MTDQPLTGTKKRKQISDAKKQVFLMVAGAAAAVMVCFVVGVNIIQRISYQNKVNGELAKTAKTLKQNVSNIDKLIENINNLKANQQLNLLNLKSDGSTVFQVIIDALPTEEDSIALSSSLQSKVLTRSNVTVEQINVETGYTGKSLLAKRPSQSATKFPMASPITFRVALSTNYASLPNLLKSLENTIRPITIDKMVIDGKDDNLSVVINATTYYSSSVDYKTGTKEVPYEKR